MFESLYILTIISPLRTKYVEVLFYPMLLIKKKCSLEISQVLPLVLLVRATWK
jgi:hypothetical protein